MSLFFRSSLCFSHDLLSELVPNLRVLLQVGFGGFSALPNFFALIGKPGTGLLNDILSRRLVQNVAGLRDTFVVHDVELSLAERRRDLILNDLYLRTVADNIFAGLDLADAADVHAHAGVKLQRVATGCRLR